MYSIYSGPKVRNSIMKIVAPYPRKISVKMLRVLLKDFEEREVLFGSNKSKTDIFPYCRVVNDTTNFLFSCVSYQEHRRSFIEELRNQKVDETLVSLLNCEKKHVISWLYCKHRLSLITLQSSLAFLLCQFYYTNFFVLE